MGPLRLPQVRAYAACMETLAFVGRDLSPGETLVRVITAHIDRHANAIAVIAQADGAHLVASRSIRGEREMKNEFADLDAALLDRVIITLVDSIHDGGLETTTTEGAAAGAVVLEDLARTMAMSAEARSMSLATADAAVGATQSQVRICTNRP